MSVTHFACGCGWPSTSLPGLQPPIHPSPLTSLSGCQPCFSTRRQPLAGDRASLVPWQFAGRPLPLVHLRGAEIRPATWIFQPTSGKEAANRFLPCEFEMATSLCLLPKDSLTTAATFLQIWKPTVCNKSNKSVFFVARGSFKVATLMKLCCGSGGKETFHEKS